MAEIRRLTTESAGRAPGKRAFRTSTGIRESDWSGVYWARWSDAILEAGESANVLQGKIPEAVLLSRMVKIIRHYGRVPTTPELRMYARNDHESINHRTIRKRYGSLAEFFSTLRDWVAGQKDHDDVISILAALPSIGSEHILSQVSSTTDLSLKEGYVYLVKSGSFYKIGRSDEIERRMKEIRIVQPEAVDLVHTIRTDDASGIEAYWHRRFADRRAKGEWFKLNVADVAAFKRRRYQ